MCKVQISERLSMPFKFIVNADDFDLNAEFDNVKFTGDILIEGEIINGGKALEVKGKVEVQRSFNCDRCLKETIDQQIVEFEEELERQDIENNIADLTQMIKENIIAAQPVQHLCKSDCKGLCSICGQNLNERECDCDRFVIDPRLNALKKLI